MLELPQWKIQMILLGSAPEICENVKTRLQVRVPVGAFSPKKAIFYHQITKTLTVLGAKMY